LSLALRIGDGHGIGSVVDDHSVVDIVVDYVRRRWRHIHWWVAIFRNWHEDWNRQYEKLDCGWWRWQVDKIRWRGRQEKYGRRWWGNESVIRIVENKHRPTEINHFLFRRRWKIIGNFSKGRRRFKLRREIREPTARVTRVWASRISTKVRPIRLRRVDDPRVSPGKRFAARSRDGANPSCHRIVRIRG
jgi:hypothetical protein